jgi:hypothetical protein
MPIGVRSEQPEQRYVWVYNQAAGGSWVKVDAEVSVSCCFNTGSCFYSFVWVGI